MVYVVEKQNYNTIAQFLLFFIILISFFIGKDYDAKLMVKILTVVYCSYYLAYIYMSYTFTSKGIIE